METMEEMMLSISGMGGAVIAHDGVNSQGVVRVDSQEVNLEQGVNQQAFPCTMCPEGFDKKLLLNNHMKNKHGVNYVFTERGRKVKLVRLPEEETPVRSNPGTSKDVEQHVFEVIEGQDEDDIDEDGESLGLGCGYAVKVETVAYQKAIVRNEIPFVAFFPLMSKHVYLLRIKDCGNNNQLLEPATKNDVLNAFAEHSKNGSIKTSGDLLPLVAFVHQVYNKVTRTTEMSITPPANLELNLLKILSQDKFTAMAFANPGSDPAEIPGPVEHEEEIDDEEPIPSKIKPKAKGRGRRQRSRSKSKPKQKPVTPPALAPLKPETPELNTPKLTTPKKVATPTPRASTPLSRPVSRPVSPDITSGHLSKVSSPTSPPPAKKPRVTRRGRAAKPKFKVPKKIKDEPMEMETCPGEKSMNGDEIGMQDEESVPQPQATSTPLKHADEDEIEEDNDSDFVRTVTCAPKKPPTGPRRRGRPRKLKFDESNEEKMDTDA